MKKTTKPHKTILVGIDYSKSSENALNYAIALAKKGKASVLLFHTYAVPVVHTNSGLFFISYSALKKSNTERLEKYRAAIQKENPGINVNVLATGSSFNIELEDLLHRHRVQYVVLGLESKSRLSKFIYGSHSTQIAGKINCPVIIVPEKYKAHRIQKAVLCVDTPKSVDHKALKKITDFSSRFQYDLSKVHVRTPEEISFDKPSETKKTDLEVVESGEFVDGVIRYSKEKNKDLIIIVSQTHSPIYNLFIERNTKTIAFRSKIPVMAIHS